LREVSATVQINEDEVIVSLDKRAHNPYLVASQLTDSPFPSPGFEIDDCSSVSHHQVGDTPTMLVLLVTVEIEASKSQISFPMSRARNGNTLSPGLLTD